MQVNDTILNENERRALLKNIIFNLAKDCDIYDLGNQQAYLENKIIGIFINFVSVYNDETFRHYYSDIYDTIIKLRLEQVEVLTTNLQILLEELDDTSKWSEILGDSVDFIAFRKKFRKLYDHVNLEARHIGFMQDYQSVVKDQKEQVQKFDQTRSSFQEESKAMSEKVENLDIKIRGFHTQSITVISIFSAIVVAFVGGLSFTSAVLESMNTVGIYRLCFISLMLGFILFNTICCLMYFVGRITNRTILRKCKSEGDCECNEEKCKLFQRIKNRMPYVYYVNFILLLGILGVFAAWFVDIQSLVTLLHNQLYH